MLMAGGVGEGGGGGGGGRRGSPKNIRTKYSGDVSPFSSTPVTHAPATSHRYHSSKQLEYEQ